jgi:uncharacterized protein involved in exopolysaccharide biosynthesis
VDSLNTAPVQHDELSLAELVEVLRRTKWRIFWFVLICTVGGTAAAFLIPKSYTAIIVISPVSNQESNGQLGALGSIVSQFGGGLASLAGLSALGDTKKAESVTVLQSEALTEKYIQQNNLLPILYKEKWDAQKKAWKETDPKKVPTLWKANEFFKKTIRKVSSDNKTGIVSLAITWKDPELAAKWANDLVSITNNYLRKKAIDESQRNIAYLNEQALRTDVVPAKQAIYVILQNEINKEMLARGSEEYAFRILDPARAPEKASSPQKILWLMGSFFGSLMLCLLAAFARVVWNRA